MNETQKKINDVYNILMEDRLVTQEMIVERLEGKMLSFKEKDSAMRQVRHIIHILKTKYHAPILSDSSGYWLAKSADEIMEMIKKFDKQTQAYARTRMKTRKSMVEMLQKFVEIEND